MSKSKKRLTKKTFSFRITPREATAVEQRADRFGLSPGQYAKALALGDARLELPELRRGPPRDAEELRRLVGTLGRIGNNLNQLAHAANSNTELDAHQLTKALEDLAVIRAELRAVLQVRDP